MKARSGKGVVFRLATCLYLSTDIDEELRPGLHQPPPASKQIRLKIDATDAVHQCGLGNFPWLARVGAPAPECRPKPVNSSAVGQTRVSQQLGRGRSESERSRRNGDENISSPPFLRFLACTGTSSDAFARGTRCSSPVFILSPGIC